MTISIGVINEVYQGYIDVMLTNPEQLIFNVVPVHHLDIDEREETEDLNKGTEVFIITDDRNVSYALGSTSMGISRFKKLLKKIENQEIQLRAKNIKIGGYKDEEYADLLETKAKLYKILNTNGDNLIDILIVIATVAGASSEIPKLELFKAGEEAIIDELPENPHA